MKHKKIKLYIMPYYIEEFECWLKCMSEEGWFLERIKGSFAYFVKKNQVETEYRLVKMEEPETEKKQGDEKEREREEQERRLILEYKNDGFKYVTKIDTVYIFEGRKKRSVRECEKLRESNLALIRKELWKKPKEVFEFLLKTAVFWAPGLFINKGYLPVAYCIYRYPAITAVVILWTMIELSQLLLNTGCLLIKRKRLQHKRETMEQVPWKRNRRIRVVIYMLKKVIVLFYVVVSILAIIDLDAQSEEISNAEFVQRIPSIYNLEEIESYMPEWNYQAYHMFGPTKLYIEFSEDAAKGKGEEYEEIQYSGSYYELNSTVLADQLAKDLIYAGYFDDESMLLNIEYDKFDSVYVYEYGYEGAFELSVCKENTVLYIEYFGDLSYKELLIRLAEEME